jgi:hypothetical protein
MRLPRFRLRTLMAAVAVTAMSAATVPLALRPWDQLLLRDGVPRGTRLVWGLCIGGAMILINALFMGPIIYAVAMIPRGLVALRKALKGRLTDSRGDQRE